MTKKKNARKKTAKNTKQRVKKETADINEDREKMLKVRENVKNKKPDFLRYESWRYKRVKKAWRKPKGIDNKMRYKLKGWPKHVSIGYRSPKKVRYYHPSGKRELIIHNVDELDKVDPRKHIVKLAHTVGYRKRVQIIARAEEKQLQIANLGVEEYETEEQEENGI